ENLNHGCSSKYQRTGSQADLQTVIPYFRKTVEATGADHPTRGSRLQNLGAGYHNRYKTMFAEGDLWQAI
ncbi:hypothetical protein EDB80DRAFT_576367, partial [Ilyonectria destructans]